MLPIRERNRIETWRSIHDAAAELTLENGLAALTVETVVARAGCSRRTFFNYFQTKEDAVLGMTEPRVTDAELRETFDRAPGEADFERTMHVLIRILEATFLDPALRGRRQLLIERAPSLRERFAAHIGLAEGYALAHLRARIDAGETPLACRGIDDPVEAARALLMLASTIIRFAFVSDPEGMLADREACLERAVATFRAVIEATR
nr:TetR/AcrR family transcriptional regulator [Pseudoclavibacter chungangensis]